MSTSDPDKPRRRRRKKEGDETAAEATVEQTSPKTEEEEAPKRKRTRARKPAAKKEEPAGQPQAAGEPQAAEAAEPKGAAEPKAAAKPKGAAKPDVDEEPKGDQEPGAAEPKAAAKPKAPEPAPARRAAPREPGVAPPVVRAQAKYVRTSARKARLVCDHLRGKSVEEARAILAHTPRAVARDWSKVLESAVANAEHNHELVGEDLYVQAIHADEGPTIKRFRPRAMGRATRIRKRTSHLTILLTPNDEI